MSHKDPHPIPLFYRLALLYIEPLCALNGAYLLLSSPSRFLDVVSPHHPYPANTSSISSTSSTFTDGAEPPSSYAAAAAAAGVGVPTDLASVRIITDMLGIFHLVFAFNLAVVLRAIGGDTRLWRVMCCGMLLSDALHILVSVREHGGWGASMDFVGWRVHDWLNFGVLWGMGVVRVGVVMGLGMRSGGRGAEQAATADKVKAR